MSKTNTITRRIEIYVNESDNEKRKEHYSTIREWSRLGREYANKIMTLRTTSYFIKTEITNSDGDIKIALKDFLDTSERNLGYKTYAKKYKELLPSTFRTTINSKVYKDFGNNIKEVLRGDRTVTSYKKDFPLLFGKKSISQLKQVNNKDFTFNFFSIPFKTKLGRDKSDNQSILEKINSKEYNMGDSSIRFKGNKMFLDLVVSIPKSKVFLDENRVVGVDLGVNVPAYVSINCESKIRQSIGDRDSFLNRRLYLQKQLTTLKRSLKYTSGGRGRKHKLGKLEDYKNKERNFVKTMNHTISKEIINFAVKNNCGVINIEDLSGIGKEEKNNFILRNWSYFELQEMIKYKADRENVKVNIINPKYSSQRCSKCGSIHSDNRKTQKEFKCIECGYEENADYNASKNISVANTKEYIKEIEKHVKSKPIEVA